MTTQHSSIFSAFSKGWLAWRLSMLLFLVLMANALPAGATVLSFSASDPDLDYSLASIIRTVSGRTFTLAGSSTYTLAYDASFTPGGLYAYDDSTASGVKLTISVESGYIFDISSFKAGASAGSVKVDLTYADGSTASFTINSVSTSSLGTLSSFGTPIANVKQVVLSSTDYGVFQDFDLINIRAIPTLPLSTTGTASSISAAGATLGGTVNAHGDSTTVTFNYGPTTGYGSSTTATQSPVTGSSGTAVSAAISGLTCNTTYHFRVNATNGGGTTTGSDANFTTSACNTAPAFVGATTILTVGENAGATDIKSLLHVNDNDSGQTETWSQGVAPNHGGTLTFTGATAGSGSTDITPGGTVAYQPANGYNGTETFTVQVSDGVATATRTITVTVAPTPTVTAVSPTNGPAAGGTSIAITGTNLAGATTVKFGGTNASSYTVNSATSITATSPAGSAGTVDITVTTAGGTSATGASDHFTYKQSQTITFANPGSQNFGTTPTLTATADSGLTPTFTSTTTGVCTITSGGALTFVTAGTCTINADQAGNSAYQAAGTVSQSFSVVAVVPGAPAIGTATMGNGQASVTFTAPTFTGGATITGYTVTASPGGATGTGAASPITVTGLTNGTAYTFSVTATNSAGTGSASAASTSVTPKASQTTTFTNPGSQNFGTTTTLTATADSGLTPTFTSTTTGVCTITTGGALTFATTGTCTINADQTGNNAYQAAGTVSQSFTVNAVAPGAPTVGTATAGDTQASVIFTAPAFTGGATITGYTVTASPGGATGTGAASPITVTGLTDGTAYTFSVTATNSAGTGSASAASTSVTPKASQTITFANPGSQNFGTTPTLTATATSGLTPTFTSATTGVCTITSGGTLTFVTTGTCTINADQTGNGSYLAATTASRSFSVAAVVPGTPVIGTATAGDTQATVAFTAPAFTGGTTITGYTVTANPGGVTGTGAASPITVAGLTNGTAYTFTVTATNSAGTGSASAASNSVTPNPGPAVVSVAVPANGSYKSGSNLDFTVTWDSSVTVAGTPRMALVIGTTTVYATYQSGSGTTATLFRYTVLPGQTDTNGITVGALTLNGGTVRNSSGTDATLTLNSVGSTASVLVDTTPPTLPAANIVVNNQSDPHKVVLTFSETLDNSSIGSAGAWGVTANGGTPAYGVAGVALTGANQVTLTLSPVDLANSATFITDAAANAHLKATPPATLTDAAGNGYTAGQVTEAGATHVLDTTAPTLGSVGVNSVTYNGGTLAATAGEKATGYWIAVAVGAAAPTVAQVKAGASYGGVTIVANGNGPLPAGSAGNLTVSGLAASTTYDLHLVAEDAAGNLSAAVSNITITTTTTTDRVVTTTGDSGAGSLRQAISDANPGDTITFSVTGTITLASPLAITRDLTIGGPGAGSLTISGNGTVQPFQVGAGTTFALQKLTVANGTAASGGALGDSATSTTIVTGCVFRGNNATVNGGAIYATGTMTIDDTLFSGNSASGNGGAITNAGATLSLADVTLNTNSAANGGGIYTTGTATIANATIAGNSATVQGGGIDVAGGTLNLKNSVVANNTAPSGADILGTATSQGYNLVRDTAGATFTATTGDLTGQDPFLGPLAANGGPTKTMALLFGSPAIDTGTCTGAAPADQRGMIRPQNGLCDMGAYERGVPATLTATAGTPQSAAINAAFATPLTATVVDSLGGVLDGVSVAFSGPASGAGITANGSTITNALGSASFSATANATAGPYTVTATAGSLSAGYSLTNSTLHQNIGAITFTPTSLIVGGTTTASATATSGLAVAFTSTTPAACTVNGAIVTGVSAGTCTIAANQAGNAAYSAATQVTGNITVVAKAGQTITFGTAPTVVVGGTGTVSATATSGLAVAFTSTTPGVCTVNGVIVTGVSAGTCTIAANQAGNAAYSAATQVTQNTTVAIPLALTVSALPDGAVTTDSTQNISGTVGNPAYLKALTVNGAAVQVAANGSFSYPTQLLDGANTITVVATGTSGTTITDTRTITLDSSALQLAVTYPPDNKAVIQQAVTVTGTIADLFDNSTAKTMAKSLQAADTTMVVTYTINGGTPGTAALTDTAYSFTTNLTSGMNTIQISAANGAGKTAQAKRTVTYQPAFSLAVSDPASDIRTVQASYLLKGVVADNTTPVTVAITMDDQTYTPTVDAATGAFQQQLAFSSNKVYQVNVTGIDRNNAILSVPRNIITVAAATSSPFTVVDALLALRMSAGLVTPDQNQTLRLDVAPLVNGVSVGDGKVDIEDVIVILRKAVGLL